MNETLPHSPALSGQLFVYNPTTRHIAFETHPERNCALILIGGMTDGPMSLPYAKELSDYLKEMSLIQPLFESSYSGYGYSTIEEDLEELDALILCLITSRNKSKLVLMGHSTGAQIVVRYITSDYFLKWKTNIKGGILQGPVSDRQYLYWTDKEKVEVYRKTAQDWVVKGRALDILPRSVDECSPTTASRYLSLTGVETMDDLFSTDLSDDFYSSVFGQISTPILVFLSGRDEYVPPNVDIKDIKRIFSQYIPCVEVNVLSEASHNVDNSASSRTELVDKVVSFCKNII